MSLSTRRMLSGVRLAQREGLRLDQAKMRLAGSRFPAFQEKPPGVWGYGMHERNLNNLWLIVQEKTE